MTREHPILMSGPSAQAILAGRKTMTRRVVRDQDPLDDFATLPPLGLRCPYGQPGDTLYVKEALMRGAWEGLSEPCAVYEADGMAVRVLDAPVRWRWKRRRLPSMFMPFCLLRLTLRVTAVRVERLQSITEEDARAEGVAAEAVVSGDGWTVVMGTAGPISYRKALARRWDSINGKRPGCSWKDNPWVFVLAFERVES